MPNAFNQRLENLPPEIWSKITKIEELKGQWIIGAQLSPQALDKLIRLKKVERIGLGRSTRYRKI